jgi:succinyl-CoA synthetase beta subunit
MAIDAKVTIDDNAFFRQKELADAEDLSAKNPKELLAEKWHLNYIHLGGNIGCLVNGAGLAMSTMDIVKNYGGSPANFLDVGGGASGPAMAEAMKLVHNDEEVEAIFVNIFGGILRCDELVKSILKAHSENKFTKPIVLRLKGTNDKIAAELIKGKEKELGITFTNDFDFAAQEVVKIAKEVSAGKGFAHRHHHH